MEGHENGHGHFGQRKRQYGGSAENFCDIRTDHYHEQITRGTDLAPAQSEEVTDEERS